MKTGKLASKRQNTPFHGCELFRGVYETGRSIIFLLEGCEGRGCLARMYFSSSQSLTYLGITSLDDGLQTSRPFHEAQGQRALGPILPRRQFSCVEIFP